MMTKKRQEELNELLNEVYEIKATEDKAEKIEKAQELAGKVEEELEGKVELERYLLEKISSDLDKIVLESIGL